MKKILKRVLSVLLAVCIVLSSSVVGFAAGAAVGSVLKSIGSYLVTKLADYVFDSATGTQAQAQYAADKIAILSVIRDWCVENNYNPDCPEFQQFILDMYLEAPDNDDMTSKYGSDWGDLHSQVHPYFAKLSSLYQCGWEEAYNWIVEHYDDDITKLKPDGTVQIPSGDLVEFIEEQNTLNTPKGKDLFKQSYQTQTAWFSNRGSQLFPIFNDSSFSQFNDLYLVPFLVDEFGVNYFSNYQFHIYYISSDDPNADIALMFDIYAYTSDFGYIKQDSNCGFLFELLSGMEPLGICTGPLMDLGLMFGKVVNQDDYSKTVDSDTFFYSISGLADFEKCFSSDGVSKEISDLDIFCSPYSSFPNGVGSLDYGFICSHSIIERTYKDIDTSKIPPNQIINITGDTIYDYSITNPDTGASTTINEYVTNNYYYPEVPSTSEPSGGGVGGNVNVGGNISVGGQVGVDITVSVPDININVNQGSGAGETGGDNVDDYIDTSGDVDVGGIIGKLPELSKGFTDYLKGFFAWLPTEIYGLIILILVISVWNVFRSRR